MKGRFEGDLQVRWLDDGRLMELVEPFCFHDTARVAWPVPKGVRTDGASIPRFLWSVVGGPFEGKYRKAAVVHDYYCDVRQRHWSDVHRMFYHAMLTSNVATRQAKILYFGVLLGGPRWTKQAMHNTQLAASSTDKPLGSPLRCVALPIEYQQPDVDEDTFARLSTELTSMPLADIEAKADADRASLVMSPIEDLLKDLS